MRLTSVEVEQRLAANDADLLRYLQRRLLDREDAADAFSEVLLVAWRQRRKMPADHEQARMWLFGIARNVLRSTRQAGARRTAATQLLIDATLTDTTAPDEASAVRDAIASLPEEQAELIRLTYWDGFSSIEAGVMLGISASAVRSRLVGARSAVRALLAGDASTHDAGRGSFTT
jgi:RNA polymerase sigma-70 factor (ECF subfamily)